MDDRSAPVTRRPGAIHIPPEEAVALAFFAMEVAAAAWTQKRNAISLRLFGLRRELEFALEHEGGMTMLLQRSRLFARR
jgi:hypothetical protein